MLELYFIFGRQKRPGISSPFVGLGNYKAPDYLPVVVLLKLFGVLDIFHI